MTKRKQNKIEIGDLIVFLPTEAYNSSIGYVLNISEMHYFIMWIDYDKYEKSSQTKGRWNREGIDRNIYNGYYKHVTIKR